MNTTIEAPIRAERLRRLRELPPAACRICGALVGAGTGTRLPSQIGDQERMADEFTGFGGLPGTNRAPGLDRYRQRVDDWRRSHTDCVPEHVAVLRRILGSRFPDDLSPAEASAAATETGVALIAARAGYAGGRAYGWITRADRRALREAIDGVRAIGRPARCADGRCGACGASHSMSWTESALRWPDGSVAPLCAECEATAEARHAETLDELRVVGAQLLGGVSVLGMTALGLRLACELPGLDRRATAGPWEYSDKLDAVRESIRIQHVGGILDPQLQDEYRRRRVERDRADRDERQAEREQKAAEGLEGWEAHA